MPNTRPNSTFDSEQICAVCRYEKEQKNFNYEVRLRELRQRVSVLLKNRRPAAFDAVVGVSGGKDSTRQALWVREALGLRPLLVSVSYPSRQQTPVGQQNLENLMSLGFETRVLRPSPRVSRELFTEGFRRFGNAFKGSELALHSGPQRIALDERIPIVFWGENPAVQVGDGATLGLDLWDGNFLQNGNTLSGGDLGWVKAVLGHNHRGLDFYRFPTRAVLNREGVQTLFLGPAWPDWGNRINAAFSVSYGFGTITPSPLERGDLYGSEMIDDDFVTINNLIKFYKYGFSRGTEQASHLIRQGTISRAEGVEIATKLDAAYSQKILEAFCQYAKLGEAEFWQIVSRFSNHDMFDWSSIPPKPTFVPGEDSGE